MTQKHVMLLALGTSIGILLANKNPFFVLGEDLELFFILLIALSFTLVTFSLFVFIFQESGMAAMKKENIPVLLFIALSMTVLHGFFTLIIFMNVSFSLNIFGLFFIIYLILIVAFSISLLKYERIGPKKVVNSKTLEITDSSLLLLFMFLLPLTLSLLLMLSLQLFFSTLLLSSIIGGILAAVTTKPKDDTRSFRLDRHFSAFIGLIMYFFIFILILFTKITGSFVFNFIDVSLGLIFGILLPNFILMLNEEETNEQSLFHLIDSMYHFIQYLFSLIFIYSVNFILIFAVISVIPLTLGYKVIIVAIFLALTVIIPSRRSFEESMKPTLNLIMSPVRAAMITVIAMISSIDLVTSLMLALAWLVLDTSIIILLFWSKKEIKEKLHQLIFLSVKIGIATVMMGMIMGAFIFQFSQEQFKEILLLLALMFPFILPVMIERLNVQRKPSIS